MLSSPSASKNVIPRWFWRGIPCLNPQGMTANWTPVSAGVTIDMNNTPLLWTVRFAAALGLTSLTLTGEIAPSYGGACWLAWLGSFWLDRYPEIQQRFRSWETAEVGILISIFLLDFFFWSYSIFVCMAHFLLLFQFFKLIGAKTLKDSLQIFIFSFFQILSACTLSVDAWHGFILLLLIPT